MSTTIISEGSLGKTRASWTAAEWHVTLGMRLSGEAIAHEHFCFPNKLLQISLQSALISCKGEPCFKEEKRTNSEYIRFSSPTTDHVIFWNKNCNWIMLNCSCNGIGSQYGIWTRSNLQEVIHSSNDSVLVYETKIKAHSKNKCI